MVEGYVIGLGVTRSNPLSPKTAVWGRTVPVQKYTPSLRYTSSRRPQLLSYRKKTTITELPYCHSYVYVRTSVPVELRTVTVSPPLFQTAPERPQ